MSLLDNSISQAIEIKKNLEKDIQEVLPDIDSAGEKIFGRLRYALETCLSTTPSVKAHQESFLNALFEGTQGVSEELRLPDTAMECKQFIRVEDQLLRISDLFLNIDFENKEKEINQSLNKVKEMVVLPILKSNSSLEAYLKD